MGNGELGMGIGRLMALEGRYFVNYYYLGELKIWSCNNFLIKIDNLPL